MTSDSVSPQRGVVVTERAPRPYKPGPRGVDSDVLRELLHRGLSNKEVNDALIERGLVPADKPLTRQYISQFRKLNGFPPQRLAVPGRDRLIPWVVAEADSGHRHYRCLELVVRDRAGRDMPARDRDRMDKFVRELFEAQAVIHYDRVNGWAAVPPRPGVDRDLIRDPRLDDEGNQVEFDPYA